MAGQFIQGLSQKGSIIELLTRLTGQGLRKKIPAYDRIWLDCIDIRSVISSLR
jgi:hypothetical protein